MAAGAIAGGAGGALLLALVVAALRRRGAARRVQYAIRRKTVRIESVDLGRKAQPHSQRRVLNTVVV